MEQTTEASLLDQIFEQGRFTDTSARERGKNLVKEFVAQVLEGSMTLGRDADQMITQRVAQIDHLISLQLNEVMHNAAFQKLEGTWRGLRYLLDQSETSTMLKIRILNVSKKDLLRDLQRAAEFDQSALFKKVYEDEFGIFGGEPFGALIWAITNSASIPRIWSCWKRFRRWRPARMRLSFPRPPRSC